MTDLARKDRSRRRAAQAWPFRRLLLPAGPGEAAGPSRRCDHRAVCVGEPFRRRSGARPRA